MTEKKLRGFALSGKASEAGAKGGKAKNPKKGFGSNPALAKKLGGRRRKLEIISNNYGSTPE